MGRLFKWSKNKVDCGILIDTNLVKEGKISENFFDNFEENFEENLEEKGIKIKKEHNFSIENLILLKEEYLKIEKRFRNFIFLY